MSAYKIVVCSLVACFIQTAFASPVIDVMRTSISVDSKHRSSYIPLTNIGDEAGTFVIKVVNVTDSAHPFTYSHKELRKLPVVISPILLRKFKPGDSKRIMVMKRGRRQSPMKLELVISQYKKRPEAKSKDKSASNIAISGSISYRAYVDVA